MLRRERDGWETLLQEASGYDPLRALEIRLACSFSDLADSICHKRAATLNIGYRHG